MNGKSVVINDCLAPKEARCDKLGHDTPSQGEGHCREWVSTDGNVVNVDDQFKSRVGNHEFYDNDNNNTDDDNDFPEYDYDDVEVVEINCGLPGTTGTPLRQRAVRLFVDKNGDCEIEVILPNVDAWDELPDYVGVTRNVSVCTNLANIYNVAVPVCCVEVVPGNYIPVFESCLEGCCHCTYILQGVVTQLRPCQFAGYILCFDSVSKQDWFVLTGVCRGFRILDKGCTSAYYCENYVTITKGKFKDEMTEKIKSELAEGKVRRVNVTPRCVHSLGGVVKSDGTLRPITDCSSPEEVNINQFMDNSCKKFHYHSVDDVVKVLDPMDYCAVTDIKGAYRSVNVTPSHRDYQGFKWDLGEGDVFFNDLCICFGLRSAPFLFTQISNFCVKCVNHEGVRRCFNYLDDFIVVGSDKQDCKAAQDKLHNVLTDLGFIIADNKVVHPGQEVKYLGIIINTVDMTLSIGEDKVLRVVKCVTDLKEKRWCSRKSLDQTAGLLAHCATVVKGGRTFSRRIYNLLRDVDPTCKRVRLSDIVMQDISWWANFLVWFNGKARMFKRDCKVVTLVTDASSTGFGGYSWDDYFWGFWNKTDEVCPHHAKAPAHVVYNDNINIGELWPVVVALHRSCQQWRDCVVEVVTDNTQVYHALRTGRGKNYVTMEWLRELFWVSAFFNIHIKSSWIRGSDNILADSLSRLKNPDCVDICADRIFDFAICCRPRLIEEGMGPSTSLVLG